MTNLSAFAAYFTSVAQEDLEWLSKETTAEEKDLGQDEVRPTCSYSCTE